jgi:hypothetical protein
MYSPVHYVVVVVPLQASQVSALLQRPDSIGCGAADSLAAHTAAVTAIVGAEHAPCLSVLGCLQPLLCESGEVAAARI